MLTDSSTLPFDREDMKLEMLPPGQEATSIMPRATIGVIHGFNAMQIRNVTAGRATHCRRIPVMMDLGWRNTFLKVSSLMPRATPNMIKASRMLTISIPFWPKFIDIALRLSNCSFIVYPLFADGFDAREFFSL